ncbi:MAG: DNA/RNA nuclease SfsA [Candidatus Helarchaeota archaeon]
MFEISEILDGYKLIKRLNRYIGLVTQGKTQEKAYVANPGRMEKLFIAQAPVYLKRTANLKRKTKYDLLAIQPKETIVCIDSRVPNWLFEDQLDKGKIDDLQGYKIKKKEYKIGSSRIDYLLENHQKKCLVELKLCTLVQNHKMLFPDAVSKRSSRHLIDLINATKQGYRVVVYFLGLRGDPNSFGPNREVDPDFSEVFNKALDSEIEIIALKTILDYQKNTLTFSDLESILIKP